jgi:hypothetical protein
MLPVLTWRGKFRLEGPAARSPRRVSKQEKRENMKRALLALLVAGAFMAGIPAYAHHSFAATYFEDKTITVEGKLVQFMFRNPHSFVHVEAPDDKGNMETWAVEWGGGGQLSREGVSRDSLKPGDHVIITGNPGRNPEDHRVRMRSIKRPSDGFGWSGVVQ